MLEINSAKIGAYEFIPDDPQKLKLKGSLFVVIAADSPSFDSLSSGREIASQLHEEYYGNLEIKPFDALKNAVYKVGNIEIAACAFVDNVVYSVARGGARVLICRGGALATILNSENGEAISASGYPKEEDVMLMATKSFFDNVLSEVIKNALAKKDPISAIQTFNSLTQGGAIVLKFGNNSLTQNIQNIIPQKQQIFFEKTNDVKNAAMLFFSNFLKKLPERRVYVHKDTENEVVSDNKKLTFSVGLILLVILAVSIGFGIRQKGINDTKGKYQESLKQVQEQVDEAISLASVSSERSRELFFDSEQKLAQIEALKVTDPKIDELRQKINDSKASVLGQYTANPQFFLDLSLLSSGFKGDILSFSNGSVSILDKTGLKIVSVAVSTKKSKVVAGPGILDSSLDLASYTERTFVLAGDGIYEVGNTKTKVVDKTWGGEALIKAFAGNLYVLDKTGNAIYRYAGNNNTFGDQHNWLAGGANVDFSGARQWSIDGSAYVLFPNSKIQKFSLGSPQSFKISGVMPEIGTIDAMYADADTQYLYFLDKAGKRVVVTDKKGSYKAQYVGDEIGNATNLVVSEIDKKIILLSGDKLLSIDIKHI